MELTVEEAAGVHRALFTEFCQQEMTAGGPDPQIKLTAEAIKIHPQYGPELAGMFVVPYSCAGAAILWRLMEQKPDPREWVPWLSHHGTTIPIRKERRPVKGAWGRFSECAATYLEWCNGEYPKVKDGTYQEVYKSVTDNVKYVGRYAAMKLLETLYQADLMSAQQNTMVPRDAKFPKRTIALLMPEYATEMTSKSHNAEFDALADALCARIKTGVEGRIGQPISSFQMETMLCIYRQSLRGKYPMGRHDSELGHWMTAMAKLPSTVVAELHAQFPFHELRKSTYDVQYLGEFNDPPWFGIRPELEEARKERMHALGVT